MMSEISDCLICRKQRGEFFVPGGAIYAFVLGHGVAHLHVHLLPRYPGTPSEYWGVRVDEWPGASQGDAERINTLCDQIREYLAARPVGSPGCG
jgi:diadenosine tetraphosphate (Ap4A) HIT family hydrolase